MSTVHEGDVKLTLPLDAIDRAMLPIAGGKAANLGELVRAGLPVPLGFCVTTTTWSSWLRILV
jgi:rifampicin phosphotransferase